MPDISDLITQEDAIRLLQMATPLDRAIEAHGGNDKGANSPASWVSLRTQDISSKLDSLCAVRTLLKSQYAALNYAEGDENQEMILLVRSVLEAKAGMTLEEAQTERLAELMNAYLNSVGAEGGKRKSYIKGALGKPGVWGALPPYSNLAHPQVQEVATATVGTGVVPIFKERGVWQAVVVRPGTHYQSPRYAADPGKPYQMTAGGFLNLSTESGKKAEHPRAGAVREMQEEIVDDQGRPVLDIAPERLRPVDTKTITFPWGEARVVIGLEVELNPGEVQKIKQHVERVKSDDAYRGACRKHTINSETGEPEICQVDIVPLRELAEGQVTLLHPDQGSLFRLIHNNVNERENQRSGR